MKSLFLVLLVFFTFSACSATGICSSCSGKKSCATDGKPCACDNCLDGKSCSCKQTEEAPKSCH